MATIQINRLCDHSCQSLASGVADRRKMMQAWADYLDALRAGGNVVSIFGKAG
jgi:hypothetical protein